MEFDAPRHWAPSIGSADVSADAGPLDGAPRAGGTKKQPPPAQDWEWDLATTISASEAPPGPGEAGSTRIHRGGCHCGAIRFEVEAPPSLVVWECNVRPAESNSSQSMLTPPTREMPVTRVPLRRSALTAACGATFISWCPSGRSNW